MNGEASNTLEEPVPPSHPTLVVGVGGAGSNTVCQLARSGVTGADLIAVNTDSQALADCEEVSTLQIGARLAAGLGAGGDPEVGRLAAEETRDVLRDLFYGKRLVVLVVGLGGGTGQGAAPVLAELAREEGALTMCFATLPFSFEGEKKVSQAENGIRRLAAASDVVIRLPNDHLLELKEADAQLSEAFAQTGRMVCQGVLAMHGLLSETGVINLDFSDVRRMVEESSGLCAIGFGEGQGRNKADQATKQALKHPFLAGEDVLARADGVLVSIAGGEQLALTEIGKVVDRVRSSCRSGCEVLMGANTLPDWDDRLAVTILVPSRAGTQMELVDVEAPGPVKAAAEGQPELSMTGAEFLKESSSTARRPARQSKLKFDPEEKGRFKNVEPTIYDGEDLDEPTFIRRGIKLGGRR